MAITVGNDPSVQELDAEVCRVLKSDMHDTGSVKILKTSVPKMKKYIYYFKIVLFKVLWFTK